MTASMLLCHEHLLVCALGSKKGKKGSVQILDLHTNILHDIQSQAFAREESFLDVSEDNGIVYVTTSQDDTDFRKCISLILSKKSSKWFDTIKGHGFV
ncbi:hypothetical protein [Bacillus safensis FO-36b] [Bacillus safensis subsp. safensis]